MPTTTMPDGRLFRVAYGIAGRPQLDDICPKPDSMRRRKSAGSIPGFIPQDSAMAATTLVPFSLVASTKISMSFFSEEAVIIGAEMNEADEVLELENVFH